MSILQSDFKINIFYTWEVQIFIAIANFGNRKFEGITNPNLIIENEKNGDQITVTSDGFYSMESIKDGEEYHIVQSNSSNVDSKFLCTGDGQNGFAQPPFTNVLLLCSWHSKFLNQYF